MRYLIALAIGLWLPAAAWAANPATTYTGTIVENVDTEKQTISIKTKKGESWTLHVTDPQMLKKHNIRKGDQVSVEVDTNNNIIKLAKAGETEQSGGMGQGSGQ
jgi:formylmethanofuran dehydrogenase subunit D